VIDNSITALLKIEGYHIVMQCREWPRSFKVGVDEWTTGRWEGIESDFVPPFIEVFLGVIHILKDCMDHPLNTDERYRVRKVPC